MNIIWIGRNMERIFEFLLRSLTLSWQIWQQFGTLLKC